MKYRREVIVLSIANVHTPESIAALNQLTQKDEYLRSDTSSSVLSYPARDAATKALADIKQ